MTTITLERRLTHKYVGTYASEDDWEALGVANIVFSKTSEVEDDNGYPTGLAVRIVEVSLDKIEPKERIKQALESMFSRHGCAHEYDCCGCWSWTADAYHLRYNRWLVESHGSANY